MKRRVKAMSLKAMLSNAMSRKNMLLKTIFILTILSSGITGCATRNANLYHWGEYENLIYSMYIEPGTADPRTQVNTLTADIQKAADYGKAVPPGVHAHLGFMYALLGNSGLSQDAFNEEKALFPESAVFIDGMMKRALANKETTHATN